MLLRARKHAEEMLYWWYPPRGWFSRNERHLSLVEECMYVVHERCCGLDIHKKIILACILICTAQGIQKKTEVFGTTVPELLRLLACLAQGSWM